jgi:hypothetical protein
MATAAASYAERPLWRAGHTIGLGGILAAISVVGIALPRTDGQLGFVGQRAVLAWIAIAILMAAVAAVAGHGVTGFWRGVLIDDRHRLSLSRLQMLLWTVLVLSAYLAAALANIGRDAASPLNVDVPSELWLVMGISTASLIASPAALAYKQRKRPGQVENLPHERDARLVDLFRGEEVTDSHHLDLGKVQMFLFTVVVVLGYALALGAMFEETNGTFATLPAVDDAVVTLLLISHAGYLTKKAVPTAPPPAGA